MELGKNTVLIKKVISRGREDDYSEKSQLGSILYNDVSFLVKVKGAGIQQADKDVIVSDVIKAMWVKLPDLYFKVTELHWNEKQINGYLAVAVTNKINDYWSGYYRVLARTTATEKDDEDDSNRPVHELRDRTDYAEKLELREKLFSAIKAICEEPRAHAEPLLAILYTFIDMQGRKNSEASRIAEELNGKRHIDIFLNIEQSMKTLFEIETIPYGALEPLREKIIKDQERCFSMSSRQITEAVYNVVKKMKAKSE